MDHLNKNTGLDLKSMDVDVKNVTFQGNRATAIVAFKPKVSPDAGMTMNYTLERQGKKWIVQQKAGGHGGPCRDAVSGSGALPDILPPIRRRTHRAIFRPGHPPVTPTASSRRNRCPESQYWGRSGRIVCRRTVGASRHARHSHRRETRMGKAMRRRTHLQGVQSVSVS